jgi:TonB family protein
MKTEAIRKDWVGRVVDARFRLDEWLGSSGQSGVFRCEITNDPEQQAAIKLFPADAAGARSCAADWAAGAELRHPHLIRVFRAGRDRVDDTAVLYVVTEYAGEILSEILPERALTPAEVKEMLGPIFDALAYLHQKGFVHGRLRPSNIMVVDDQLKLSVENIRGPSAIPKPPQTLEVYDAPESTLGKPTPALDVWSLGVTLVEALTQAPPAWNRASPAEPVVPVSLPKPFAEIAQGCLRLDPALRCTLSEIKACLETGAPIPHRATRSGFGNRGVAKSSSTKSGRRRLAVIAASAVVLVAAFAFVMMHSHETASSTPADSSTASSTPTTNQQTSAAAPAPAQLSAPAADAVPPSTPNPDVKAPPPAAAAETSTPPPAQPPVAAPQAPPPSQTPPAVHSGPAGKGAVAQQIMPDVPERAMRSIQGKVQVSIRVNVDQVGAVSDASFASQGPSRYFANSALQAAKSWKFSPAQQNGQPVPSVWLLHFEFRKSGVGVAPTEQSP